MSRDGSETRRRIAREAARLLREAPVLSIAEARERAIERLAAGRPRASDLPTDADISRQLQHAGAAAGAAAGGGDRFAHFESLLLPLEDVKQNPTHHPEGDALYHSLQVFDHARDAEPYDGGFLAAALLHDVGKGIDPRDHVAAGLAALEGSIGERTAWLIEHHMLCHDLHEGRLGARAKRRLRESPWFDDLVLLGECDRAGRQVDVETVELAEAISYLRVVFDPPDA